MKDYKHPNGRVISRSYNGRFRKTTLADFGISNKQINDGSKRLYCPKCKKSCMPIMLSAKRTCEKCGISMIWK